MRLVRLSLLAVVLGALGAACGADERADTTPATNNNPDFKAGASGEVGVGEDGAEAKVNGEVKAGDVGAKAGVGADVNVNDDGVQAGANVQGTTDASKDRERDDDDQQKQQPLPSQDPNQPNPEQPQQPPQPEQPETGTTP
jgi:hypothetical protein